MIPEAVLAEWARQAVDVDAEQRRYHRANHEWPKPRAYDDCWMCGRQRAVCKSKIRHETMESAQAMADEVNAPGRASLVLPYRCRWGAGLHFHVRTAKTVSEKKVARKRMARRLA